VGANGVGGVQNPSAGAVKPLITSSAAFTSGAGGVSYQAIKVAIQSIIAILLFLWTAFVTWGQFKLWGENSISIMAMQSTIIRATVVMMLLVFVFMG
jgi:integrating conjugative element protein (TIGR03758 family)